MTDLLITLAGKEYPVPLLAPKQNRIAVPACMRLLGLKPQELTTPQYDDLIELAFVAAQRGTPDLNKVTFMDLPITTRELLDAFPTIMKQTGLFKESGAGEETAGNSQTGIG